MIQPSAEQLRAVVMGFDALYGLELLSISDTEVNGRVSVRDDLKQGAGLVHGGVYAAMAESMASLATALSVLENGEMAMGLSNSTSFLRPVTEGSVNARAERIHRGRTTWVWDVTFTDEQGRTCAVTRMTIAVRALPNATGRGAGGGPFADGSGRG
jgi:uncharacterized protein (TIGR00369 family)